MKCFNASFSAGSAINARLCVISPLQKKTVAKNPETRFLKPNPVGFISFFGVLLGYGFFGLNPGFVKRPNLTGFGISMGFQLSE